ncbi:MAG TPA: TetR/AcrR family transcriptional regulator [Steroidobacteraceae bacterium]|nr:TetR/AcrR family transcriptional regulator [Steroidobacteraceae bacterium]
MATRRPARKRPAEVGYRTRVAGERRLRTRARILESAVGVFARKGPDAPVIDDFIRAAGVARGTFYNYFTSTEELLAATTHRLEDDLMVRIERELESLDDPVLRLATGVRLWLRWARSDRTFCEFIVRSRFRGELVERIVTTDLRRARAAGEFSFRSLPIARDLVVGTIRESMNRILQDSVPRSYVDEVARLILRGVGLNERRIRAALERPVPAMRPPRRTPS